MMCDRASIISNNRRKCREHDEKIVKREIFYVETYSQRQHCETQVDKGEYCEQACSDKEESETEYCQCENCLRLYEYFSNNL